MGKDETIDFEDFLNGMFIVDESYWMMVINDDLQ